MQKTIGEQDRRQNVGYVEIKVLKNQKAESTERLKVSAADEYKPKPYTGDIQPVRKEVYDRILNNILESRKNKMFNTSVAKKLSKGLDVDIAVASTLNWMEKIMPEVMNQIQEWVDERFYIVNDEQMSEIQAEETERRKMNIAAINMMKLEDSIQSGNGMSARDGFVIAYDTTKRFRFQETEMKTNLRENY